MKIGKPETARVFSRLRSIMDENRERLIRLDAELGDGDLGITMAKAFTAVETLSDEISGKAADPGRMFSLAGTEIARSAPSTMGTLLASAFMTAGKKVAGRESLDGADLADFIAALAEGIAGLGAARRGDKTILDVLYPAAEAAAGAARQLPGDLRGVIAAALAAAEKGLEDSKAFMAVHGRPGIFREKTIGLTDPGGATGVLILQAFQDVIRGISSEE